MSPREFCPLRPYFSYVMPRSAVQLTTTIPRSLLVQSLSRSLDDHSRWMRRRSISRDSDVGVSLSVSYLTSPRALLGSQMPLFPLPGFADESPFPHHAGGNRLMTCHLTFSCHRSRLTGTPAYIRGIYDTPAYLIVRSRCPRFGLTFVATWKCPRSRYASGSGASMGA